MPKPTLQHLLAARLAGMAIVFFLALPLFWTELKYRCFASTTTATVTNVSISSPAVQYRFTEPDGTIRAGSDEVDDPRAMPPLGSVVQVQYFPTATGSCRLTSSALLWPLVIAGGVGVLMIVGTILVIGDLRAIRRARSQPATPAFA